MNITLNEAITIFFHTQYLIDWFRRTIRHYPAFTVVDSVFNKKLICLFGPKVDIEGGT
jgi:hypothetical protein